MFQTFWSNLKNSFYNPAFYVGVTQWRTQAAAFFVLGMCLVYEIILVLVLSVTAVPALLSFSPDAFINSTYPEELVVTIEKGIVSTNVTEPFIIPAPISKDAKIDDFKNILVIDTTHDVSVSEIESYESMAILTRDSLIVKESKEKTQIVPLKDIDLEISKENIQSWSDIITPILKVAVIPLTIMVLLVMAPFMLLSYLFTALFWAFLTMGIGWMRGNPLRYKQAYRVSLVALGPVIVLSILMLLLGVPALPFSSFILFVLVVWLNLQLIPKEPVMVAVVENTATESETKSII